MKLMALQADTVSLRTWQPAPGPCCCKLAPARRQDNETVGRYLSCVPAAADLPLRVIKDCVHRL